MDEQDKQELEMLRAFYLEWVGLHTLDRTEENRSMLELKAQNLVEAAHCVAEFRKGREGGIILNG